MLQDLVESPGDAAPEDLLETYRRELADVVESVGVETAAGETGVSEATLADLRADGAALDLADAAAVLALDPAQPNADAIRREALDDLLLGMTTAVLDVETLAANLALDLSPRELQQRIEGRAPMTLAEYVHVLSYIDRQKP
ncbi:MAG: DUF5791 family protein [Halobacteriales archaeon]